jgi:lia operon protein LiaF
VSEQSDRRERGHFRRPDRLVIGGALVVLGLLYLLKLANVLDAGDVVRDWWPVILIAMGLAQLAERPRTVAGPTVLIVAGAIVLLFTLDLVSGSVWRVVWPVLLVLAGLAVIVRAGRR